MPLARPAPLLVAGLIVLMSMTAGCLDAGAPPATPGPGDGTDGRGADGNDTSGSGGAGTGSGSGAGSGSTGGNGGNGGAGNGTSGNGTSGNGTAGNGTAGNTTGPAQDWPTLSQATIRPGIMLYIDNPGEDPDGYCTANFVYRSPTNGTLYIGMAAHCTSGVGAVVHRSPDMTYFSGDVGPRIGKVVYTSWDAMGWSPGETSVGDDVHLHDFALIEIDAAKADEVHPAVLHFGGPVAPADYDAVGAFDRVIVYGNTPLRPGPEQLDWQEGIVNSKASGTKDGHGWHAVRTMVPGSIQGDSGSGLMTKDGKALGVLSVISVGFPGGVENVYSSLPYALEYLRGIGWEVELQTWELLDGGLP